MTKYQIQLKKKEEGELSILFNHFELPLKYQQWMDIYAYHLAHPKKSQWQEPQKQYLCTVFKISFMHRVIDAR